MDDFQEVQSKKKHRRKTIRTRLDKEYVIKTIYDVLMGLPPSIVPYYACIVGSVARNSHTINSDVDMICIWNHVPNISTLETIQAKITEKISTSVDLIAMKYVQSFVNHDEQEQAFFDNDVCDAVNIIGNTPSDIMLSKVIYKLV